MFVQQKIMPTTADPNMAKMMLILPDWPDIFVCHIPRRARIILGDK